VLPDGLKTRTINHYDLWEVKLETWVKENAGGEEREPTSQQNPSAQTFNQGPTSNLRL
jgi:hypothetical protein